MVKNLYIIRHAQALEATKDVKDIERSLTLKGYKDASRLGKYFFYQEIFPDLIISSDAERAKNTATLIAEQLSIDPQRIFLKEELYQASVRNFLEIVNELPPNCHHAMMVGHNPTLSYFAEYITQNSIGEVVPSGMVHIRFDLESWDLVSQGNGIFVDYKSPEDIQF